MDMVYYIILGVTAISYLLGLFLSYFEKKGRISVLSGMGNVGFVNIYGINTPIPEELRQQQESQKVVAHIEEKEKFVTYVDDEII